MGVKFLFHLPSCLARINKPFFIKMTIFVNGNQSYSYYQVLEIQLRLYRSHITIKSFAVHSASSTGVYCYASSTTAQQYTDTPAVQQWLLRTVQLHFIWPRYSLNKVSISSTRLFA